MSDLQKKISLLFNRPGEPLFYPKGNYAFDLPDSFYEEEHLRLISSVHKKSDADNINLICVKNISLPDLSVPMQLEKDENFSLFIPRHKVLASYLVDIFMAARSVEDLISIGAYCHDRINPYMYNYALSIAMLHRPDTSDFEVPSLVESFPSKFLNSCIFSRMRLESTLVPEELRTPIVIDKYFTANELEPEQRMAYFREDLGISLHHWHWHLVYPANLNDINIVAKNRRGELFFYMHQQLIARYNSSRLCNNLSRVKSLNLREPVIEGYFSKLHLQLASRYWPPRFMNTTLSDTDRPKEMFAVTIKELEQWASNLKLSIEDGYLIDSNGNSISLMNSDSIDILGNTVESSLLSPNKDLYGDLHNLGHLLIAFCHDPTGRFLESYSVMGDTATSMRDPVFYRWHSFINDIFYLHKDKLPSYTEEQLSFKGVSITKIQIDVLKGIPNQLQTFWEQSDVDMSKGLDFSPHGSIYVRFTHLQHIPFTYNIKILNDSQLTQQGTVRIFLAPMFDENGSKMPFNEQRRLMIELDRFKVNLKLGLNEIVRKSVDSSVTIPFEKTFRNLNAGRQNNDDKNINKFNFCGCGWPHHLLIPKGSEEEGSLYELFVMISDYTNDKVIQDQAEEIYTDAESYCGIRDKKYPDKQSMGYPFDRIARNGVDTLFQFLTPNMRVLPVTITFTDDDDLKNKKESKQYTVVKPNTNK